MRLNLREIIQVPGGCVPFSFSLDLSEEDWNGKYPFQEPIQVSGQVKNEAGVLVLSAQAETRLHEQCDRCWKEFIRPVEREFEFVLADQPEEEDDELIPLDGDEIDAGELIGTSFLLEMDSKVLCKPDCKGLCPGCGADLNEEACRCKAEVDPRLAALQQLLDK